MAESYTTLKGFNSISDTDIQSAVLQNVLSFFDWGFIDKGAFSNVRLNTADIRAKNKSRLRLVNDPNYTNGQVWSTFRENLVWESGVSCTTQPVQISGVYVNGAFKSPTASGYEHYVDYNNGRVIFSSAISTSSTVNMEYSYKDIYFTTDEVVPLIKELQQGSYNITSDFTVSSGDWSQLDRAKAQLPIVTFEVSPLTKFRPLELGSSAYWVDTDILVHVLAEDDEIARKLSNFISYQIDKTIWMFDINLMASSGAFPIDYRGAKASNPLTYPSLVKHNNNGGYRYNKLTFTDATLQGPTSVGTIYHSVVRFNTEVVSIV
jgi:hypothetical protein